MRRYDLIVFDMDGTLFDFRAAEEGALTYALGSAGLPHDEETLRRFRTIDQQLWKEFSRGELTREQVYERRFLETLERNDLDTETLNTTFLNGLSSESTLLPGALEVVSDLSALSPIAIATNGDVGTQSCRMADSELVPYVQHLIISSDVGFVKPDKRFFAAVEEKAGLKNAKVIMIGDDYEADIVGAHRAGWDTCWVTSAADDAGVAKYKVRHLKELLTIF